MASDIKLAIVAGIVGMFFGGMLSVAVRCVLFLVAERRKDIEEFGEPLHSWNTRFWSS